MPVAEGTCTATELKPSVPFIVNLTTPSEYEKNIREWVENGMKGQPTLPKYTSRSSICIVGKELEARLLRESSFVQMGSYSNIYAPYQGEFGMWRGIVWVRASPVVFGAPDIIGM